MHVGARSGLKVLYSSISGMNHMVFTNTVKVKSVGMGWGRIIMIKKEFKIHGVE
jgi:hypothetical protein